MNYLIAQITGQPPDPYLEWTKAVAPIAGPTIGATITVIGVAATLYYTFRKGRLDAKFEYAGEALKLRLRQVEEFYAPMLLLLEQSRLLYEKLKWSISNLEKHNPGSTGITLDGFRLLDHLYRIMNEDGLKDLRGIVKSILRVGDKMSTLISDHSGLIEGGITETFIQYRAHLDLLKASARQEPPKDAKDGWQEFGYYPRVLNREVREGYKEVLRHFETFQDAADATIWKLLEKVPQPHRQTFRKLRDNLSFYERKATDYAAKFDNFELAQVYDRFFSAMRLPEGANANILDAGCGTGRDTAAFIRRGHSVSAFDVSPAMLRESFRKIRSLRESGESEAVKNGFFRF